MEQNTFFRKIRNHRCKLLSFRISPLPYPNPVGKPCIRARHVDQKKSWARQYVIKPSSWCALDRRLLHHSTVAGRGVRLANRPRAFQTTSSSSSAPEGEHQRTKMSFLSFHPSSIPECSYQCLLYLKITFRNFFFSLAEKFVKDDDFLSILNSILDSILTFLKVVQNCSFSWRATLWKSIIRRWQKNLKHGWSKCQILYGTLGHNTVFLHHQKVLGRWKKKMMMMAFVSIPPTTIRKTSDSLIGTVFEKKVTFKN